MQTTTIKNSTILCLISENQANKDLYNFYKLDNDLSMVIYPLHVGMKAAERNAVVLDLIEQYKPVCTICADTNMFKTLTKKPKVKGLEGYPVNSAIGPVFWIPNYVSTYYNPTTNDTIVFIMGNVNKYAHGVKVTIGEGVIQQKIYCKDVASTKLFLDSLLQYDRLAVDIETAGNNALKHYDNYIISIAFAWDKHSGGAVYVNGDTAILGLLREFFDKYTGTCMYHNCSFDIQNLIYHLYMHSIQDIPNMLLGLHTMCKNFDDTLLIAYLATNTCAGNNLGLKELSQKYTGNYAQDEIADCTKIPVDDLLRYNLTDVCATWYVYDTYYPIMVRDGQEELYKTMFLPTQKVLLETQLVGLRINSKKLDELDKILASKYNELMNKLNDFPIIKKFTKSLQDSALATYIANRKTPLPPDKCNVDYIRSLRLYAGKLDFNPKSPEQMCKLLYSNEYLGLEIVDTTKKGTPSTSKETLEKLVNKCTEDWQKELLGIFVDLSGIQIIISNFMQTFKESPTVSDGVKGIYGSFKLGGTKTGRLSSKQPNLQNFPSTGSPWAKAVKGIFTAPKDFIFVGADQRSLEDRISALTTKDTNKCKVYTEGYDGHCLRAYSYFSSKMPDIVLAEETDTCYKIVKDDGTVEYVIENE